MRRPLALRAVLLRAGDFFAPAGFRARIPVLFSAAVALRPRDLAPATRLADRVLFLVVRDRDRFISDASSRVAERFCDCSPIALAPLDTAASAASVTLPNVRPTASAVVLSIDVRLLVLFFGMEPPRSVERIRSPTTTKIRTDAQRARASWTNGGRGTMAAASARNVTRQRARLGPRHDARARGSSTSSPARRSPLDMTRIESLA